MNAPLVSIVLPVYNGGDYLAESIRSCLSQTYDGIELVIVNDASSDNTVEVVKSFSDERLRLVHNETNQGLPRSLNIGFREARGELLTWTSADNLYAPDAIEALVNAIMATPTTGLVYGDFYLIDECGIVIGKKECSPPVYLPRVNAVGAYFLYRREVMETVGEYDPDLRLAEDYDYWLRVYNRFKIRQVKADGYYYRVHSESLTGTSREAEIVRMTALAQRKNRNLRGLIRCGVYGVIDPLAAKMSRSPAGGVLRSALASRWRAWAGK